MTKPNPSELPRIGYAAEGDWPEAQSILREASQWLIDTGRPLWTPDAFTEADLRPRARRGEIVLGRIADHAVAVMFLTWHDPLFWPEIAAGEAGYVHKLAVRRAVAGKGVAQHMLRWTADEARQRNCQSLRLDCDDRPSLRQVYVDADFRFVDVKLIEGHRAARFILRLAAGDYE